MINVYTTHKGVHGAMKRQGISGMVYDIVNHDSSTASGWTANVMVHDIEDKHDVESRGFLAEINVHRAAD